MIRARILKYFPALMLDSIAVLQGTSISGILVGNRDRIKGYDGHKKQGRSKTPALLGILIRCNSV